MSRYLPIEIKHLILHYLPLVQISRFPLSQYFWISRLAAEANTSTDEVYYVISNIIKQFNLTRLAGYFNIIIPDHPEHYFCPVQCYISLLDNPNFQLREKYLKLSLSYLEDILYFDVILNIIGNQSLNYPWLVTDIIYIYQNTKTSGLAFLAYAYVRANYMERATIGRIAARFIGSRQYQDYLTLISIVAGTWTGSDKYLPAAEVVKFAIQLGYANTLGNVPGLLSISVIEGYLLHGDLTVAEDYLWQHQAEIVSDGFNPEMFMYVDALKFYQALETFMGHKHNLTEFYFNTLKFALSTVKRNGVQTPGQIFHYVLNKINLLDKTQVYALTQVLTYKAIFDFAGFYQIWSLIKVDAQFMQLVNKELWLRVFKAKEAEFLIKSR